VYVIIFIESCFNFISIFTYVLPSCDQSLSLCPASSLSCAILSHTGLLEVSMTNLRSLRYFLAWGPVLPNDFFLEKANAKWEI
jgi:hypothetical protein